MELFKESKIKNLTLKNRFFRGATWEDLATDDGKMTDKLFTVYEELAEGGVGTIITGYAYVTEEEKPNPGMMGIYNDSFIEEYKPLVEMSHSHNTAIILQVAYGGSMTGLNPPSAKIFGPSSVKNESTGVTPIEMTKEDIEYLQDSFVKAAIRAEKAGFDGVEFHSAHGYLFSHFLSNDYNLRTDEYGGSIENRIRLLKDIVVETKKKVGENFLVMTKINSEDFTEKGLTREDSIKAIKILEEAGLDAIEVSGGNSSSLDVLKNNLSTSRKFIKDETESYFADYAKELVKEINIPVILIGGHRNYSHLEKLYLENDIDYFALSRPLIRESNLIDRWKNGDTENNALCISCNACFRMDGKRCVFNK